MLTKAKWLEFLDVMDDMFPDAHCELVHENPFELTIATLLSAQCTDALVNRVTKGLFQKYKTPQDYLDVELEELQNNIRSIGLYRNKAKNIQLLCRKLIDEYNGEIPASREALVTLPGVGRKTANVVLSVAFDVPALAVDTCRTHYKTTGPMPLEGFSAGSGRDHHEKDADRTLEPCASSDDFLWALPLQGPKSAMP